MTVQGLSPCQTLSLVGCSLCSADVTPHPRSYGPIRHPLAFDRFPGWAGYTIYPAPVISRRDEEGFSSCLACPCHRAVASTPPRQRCRIGQIFGAPYCLRPTVAGSALGFTHFRGHIRVHCCYGPVARDLPRGDLVDRLQDLGFPPPCYPNYGAPDYCPGRSVSC